MACWGEEERRRGYIDALGEAISSTQGILQPIFRKCSALCSGSRFVPPYVPQTKIPGQGRRVLFRSMFRLCWASSTVTEGKVRRKKESPVFLSK